MSIFTLQKRLILINFFLLVTGGFGRDIKVCVWKGRYSKKIYEKFKKKYRGSLYLQKFNDKWLLINKLDIEEYLYGVVGKEMDENWPIEALKAQAVCSRTFVLWKMEESKEKNLPYDIESSIYHQVYGRCENEKIIKAVESTRGEVLTYNGKIAKVFFHACCGGKTAKPEDVWGGNYPGLVSVNDPYCKKSPYFSWEKIFSKRKLSEILNMGKIEKIEILEKGSSGRVKLLGIVLKNGKCLKLSGHKFRIKINEKSENVYFTNPYTLPSTLFEVKNMKDRIIFKGKGYGHGVGMCQWGARIMAEKGYNYKEILKFYFGKFKLENIE